MNDPGTVSAGKRSRKIGNAHIFEALITRDAAKARLVDEFLSLFGGRMQPVMAQLIEAGNLTPKDVADGPFAAKFFYLIFAPFDPVNS